MAGGVWLQPSVVLIALALTGVVCVVAALRAQRIAWLPLAALWMLLGAWCGEMEPHPAPAPALAEFSDGLLRTVEGTVIDAGPVRTDLEQNVGEPSTASPLATHRPARRKHRSRLGLKRCASACERRRAPDGAFAGQHWRAGIQVRRTHPRRSSLAAAGDLSRSRRLEPRGLSAGPGDHVERLPLPAIAWSAWAARPERSCRAACTRGSTHRLRGCLPFPPRCADFPRPCASRKMTLSCCRQWSPETAPILRTPCVSASSAPARFTCWWFQACILPSWRRVSSGSSSGCACRAFPPRFSPSPPPLPTRSSPASPRRCSARSGW